MGEAAAAMLAELQSETDNMKVSQSLAHPIMSNNFLCVCVYIVTKLGLLEIVKALKLLQQAPSVLFFYLWSFLGT